MPRGAFLTETRGIDAPRFTLEFPDIDALRAACDGCLEAGVARLPEVATLEVGDRCELAFVTAGGGEPREVLRGRVTGLTSDPPGVELAIDGRAAPGESAPPPRRSDPRAALRNLPVARAVKLAGTAGQRERVALERMYGKTVWQALLCNPKITIPEVARIARKRALPRPLLATIVENPSWVTASVVRRAALANPRLTSAMALSLLRQTPRNELKLVTRQTTYPMAVRELARKLLES